MKHKSVMAAYLIIWCAYGSQAHEAQLASLEEQLSSTSVSIRRKASEAFAQMGPDARGAVSAIIVALDDSDEVVRHNSAGALTQMHLTPEEIVLALIEVLQKEKAKPDAIAKRALSWLGVSAGEALIKALQNDDKVVRCYAAKLFPQIAYVPPESIPALIQMWQGKNFGCIVYDDFRWIHHLASQVLVEIGTPAIPALITALSHEEEAIRWRAASTLGDMGEIAQDAVPALIRLWQVESRLRINIVYSLMGIGEPVKKIAPVLIKTLNDGDAETARWAAHALNYMATVRSVKGKKESMEVREAIPELTKASKTHPNYEVRREAVRALISIGGATVAPALIDNLSDEHETVRKEAAWSLGGIGAKVAVPALIDSLSDEHETVRDAAAWSLGEIGAKVAMPALTQALTDESNKVRHSAVVSLIKIGDSERTVPSLLKALSNEKWEVRKTAISGLEHLGSVSDGTVSALIHALKDSHHEVRISAIQALETIYPTKEVAQKFVEIIGQSEMETSRVGKAAAEALGNMADEEIVLQLSLLLSSESRIVRLNALHALGEIGSSSPNVNPSHVIWLLVELLGNADREVRQKAIRQLAKIGHSTVPVLVDLLAHKNHRVREGAGEALSEIESLPQEIMIPLIQVLRDENEHVRLYAAIALTRIGIQQATEEAAPVLTSLLKAKNLHSHARWRAAFALKQIGTERSIKAAIPVWREVLMDEDEASVTRVKAASLLREVDTPESRKVLEVHEATTLLKALSNEKWEVRKTAISGLEHLGSVSDGTVSALIHALKDSHHEVRISAIQALETIYPTKEVAQKFVEIIGQSEMETSRVGKAAAEALGNMADEEIVLQLSLLLSSESRIVRLNALHALGEIGSSSPNVNPSHVIWLLVELLGNADREVRQKAIRQLAKIGHSTVPVLVDLLAHKNHRVREGAGEALSEIESLPQEIMIPLIQVLRDENEHVRLYAAIALTRIGIQQATEEAAPVLTSLLKAKNLHSHARWRAAFALKQIGTERSIKAAIPVWREVLMDEDEASVTRVKAASLLREVDTPESRKVLEVHEATTK